MMSLLFDKVRKTISRHRMLSVGDRVVAAVSGGPDSVALLGILKQLETEYALKLVVAHLNHGLRGEQADAEEKLVHQLSDQMGLVFESKKADITSISRTLKLSVEEAAREARYRFLETVRCRYQADKIALGHHARDQAETVLMNFLRGSGTEGLRGMPPMREGIIIRPLIEATRDEIDAFIGSKNLRCVTDPSNTDERYYRNRIRHRLMPELETHYNPRLEENLCRSADILRVEDDYLRQVVNGLYSAGRVIRQDEVHGAIRLDISEFLGLHEAIQNRLIKHVLLRQAVAAQGIGYRHIMMVRSFMERRRPSGFLHLPFNVEIRREYGWLVIGKRQQPLHRRGLVASETGRGHKGSIGVDETVHSVEIPGRVELREQKVALCFDFVDKMSVSFDDVHTAYMDYEAILAPLTVRLPKPGDRIQPLGMKQLKKLKNVFIDRKIPIPFRHRLPLVADAHSILWIPGHLLSERIRIVAQSKKVLKVHLTEMI